ncbi:MAG TPA: EamA family transporter [Ruminiclostridium sp.]|nr:EamA family transporter [Ruminiclostridium sp.]
MNSLVSSLKKNKTGMAIMVFSALASSLGQYVWKVAGMNNNLFLMLCGFALYGLGAVCMITAFRYGSFSVLHPMQSLGYVFAIFIGLFLLNEAITPQKTIGLLFILFGVIMIGVGDE